MQRWLKCTEDFLKIILNFLVVLCLFTAADALAGGLRTPVLLLCLPVCLPFFFHALRKRAGNLFLFLVLHPAAVVLLVGMAAYSPLSFLLRIVFALTGTVYALHSIQIRIMGGDDAQGEMPAALAGFLAAASFFVCGYVKETAGGERIVWICFAWLLLFLLNQYVGNFIAYVEMNRRMSGAMPEKSIFRAGMVTVGGYSCFSVLLLILCAQTPFVGWLSRLVEKAGHLLARLIFWFVMLFAGEEGEPAVMGETGAGQMPLVMQAGKSPAWLRFLDKIITTAVTFALIGGALVLLALLIRFLIQRFYNRQKDVKEVTREGFVEEEEHLGSEKRRREKRLPVFGGTMQQRVRRIFKRTVQESFPGACDLSAMTAREIAGQKPDCSPEEWALLSELYERARYAQDTVTKKDVKAAGKLSGAIVHNIK